MWSTSVAVPCLRVLTENPTLPIISGDATFSEDTSSTYFGGRQGERRLIPRVSGAKSTRLFGRGSSLTQTFSTMARLRSLARKRQDQRQAEQANTTPAPAATGSASEAMSAMGTTNQGSMAHSDLQERPFVVPAIGEGPPLGSQEIPLTPPRSPNIPNYTWERTTPVRGKESGLFVLHLGPTPQSSPMSRDPPNRIVNREQLKQALRAKLSRARRGENGVKRSLLQQGHNGPVNNGQGRVGRRRGRATPRTAQRPEAAVAPPGWGPPEIWTRERSPVQLRPRLSGNLGEVPPASPGHDVADIAGTSEPRFMLLDEVIAHTSQVHGEPENGGMIEDDDVRFFNPGASPPHALWGDPVHSPSDHTILDNRPFPETQHVIVNPDTLGLDPGLVGDEHGVSGVVLTRFYHYVTGTPMFQVHFGDVIGARSVRVCDTAVDVTRAFGDTQRTLFPDDEGTAGGEAGPFEPEVQEDSDDDPEWQGAYEDFQGESADGGSSSDSERPAYTEDPLRELGLYSCAEDVSNWPFEKLFADDQWQEQSITLLQNTDNFSGPIPGPTVAVASRPTDYFLRFWPPELLERVVVETNRYAIQPSQLNPAVTNGRADWTPLDSEELLAWFGILILMGLKEFPHIRCYWNRLPFYNCPLISEAMPRKRFEAIIRCLHLVNNETLVTDRTDPAYDKLAKVRWVCESFARMSQSLYNNERVLTVDEIMIPYKGRFCNIRQYMKSKPVKFGVKVWALANSESRYVSNVIVYLGADDTRTAGDSVGENAVLTAIAGLEGRGHVIITDNFFTSPRLFMELLRRGFWATGTCRKTRKGFPASLVGFSQTELPERGHLVVKMHRSRNIAAICWMDAKPVFLLSTATHPIGEDSYAGHWIGRERVDFPTSPILLQYQAGMRGVDIVDQQRQEYSTQLHSHKWWHRIFMFVLDSSLLNSYILYACDRRALGLPVHARLLWHYDLAEDLIRPRIAAGHIRGPLHNLAVGGLHFSSGHPMLRRRCVVCDRRIRRMCSGCGGIFQCEGACFQTVHTQHGYLPHMRGGAV